MRKKPSNAERLIRANQRRSERERYSTSRVTRSIPKHHHRNRRRGSRRAGTARRDLQTKPTGDSKPVLQLAYGFEALEPNHSAQSSRDYSMRQPHLVYGRQRAARASRSPTTAMLTRTEMNGWATTSSAMALGSMAVEGRAGSGGPPDRCAVRTAVNRDISGKIYPATGRPMQLRKRAALHAPDPRHRRAIRTQRAAEPTRIIIDTVPVLRRRQRQRFARHERLPAAVAALTDQDMPSRCPRSRPAEPRR